MIWSGRSGSLLMLLFVLFEVAARSLELAMGSSVLGVAHVPV